VGTGSLGMNDTLRDSLAVKVRKLLNQVHVLQQHRSTLTDGQ
jgi:hypothetical protein